MTRHYIIPPYVHKELGCKNCHKLSKKLEGRRNCIRRFFTKAMKHLVDAIPGLSRKTYTMKNTEGTLPGTLRRAEGDSGDSGDMAVDAAHNNAKIVYDFYKQIFNRNSLDDKGLALVGSAHYGNGYNNAYWDGSQMVYGDGDGKFFVSLSKALDVCGHEMTHGVVQFGPGLMYVAQSGALNESFADIFGVTIKQWHLKQSVSQADWLVGPDIVGSEFPGKAIRSFKDEKAYADDPQPKYMKNYKWMWSDSGGVHINSGIPNHLYYQFCLLQGGNAWDAPIKIWYSALFKLGNWSNFGDLKKALMASATELYGKDSKQVADMTAACKVIGI